MKLSNVDVEISPVTGMLTITKTSRDLDGNKRHVGTVKLGEEGAKAMARAIQLMEGRE